MTTPKKAEKWSERQDDLYPPKHNNNPKICETVLTSWGLQQTREGSLVGANTSTIGKFALDYARKSRKLLKELLRMRAFDYLIKECVLGIGCSLPL